MTHKAAAKFFVAQHVLTERLSNRERGASALEYVGMIIVAAVVVGAVAGLLTDGKIKGALGPAINGILGTGEGAGETP